MKIKDVFKVSFRNAYRNKVSYLIMILISISCLTCLFSLSYKHSFQEYWKTYVQKNPEFRIMNVYYGTWIDKKVKNSKNIDGKTIQLIKDIQQEVIEKLNENVHILGASTQTMQLIQIVDFNNNFYLQPIPLKNNINIVSGYNLDQYTEDEKVMICPNIMRLSNENGEFNIKNTIDMEKYLNQNININYAGNLPYEFKVVGLYDTHSTYSYGGICYTSYKNLEDAQNAYYEKNPNIYQNIMESKTQIYDYIDNIYIMIDDIKNLKEVDKFLEKNELFQDGAIVGINTDTVEEISSICNKITIVFYILAGLIIGITLIQNIIKKNRENFIYYAVGYTDKDMLKMFLIENSILVMIGFILSTVIVRIGLMIYKNQVLVTKSRLYLMNPRVDIISFLMTLLLALSIPLIATITIHMISKNKRNNLEVD